MPSKIKEVFSWAPYCDGGFFTAYDPPSALTSVTAVAPPVPPNDPEVPVSSVTLDPPAQSTIRSETSTPKPASIPKVDQPKATIAGTPIPTHKETSSTKPQANDRTTQESSPSQAQLVQPNGDPKGGDSPQQNTDPKHDKDTKQTSDPKPQHNNGFASGDHPGQPGDLSHGSDPKLQQNSDPKHGDGPSKASGPSHRIDPTQGSEPTNTADTSPHNNSADDQAGTTNKQMVKPASDSISTTATSPNREAPPITPSGTKIIASGNMTTEDLMHGAHSGTPDRIITTTIINGQAITANSAALIIAGKVLTPGAPDLGLNGTVMSFDTAAQLVLGTQTVLLELKRPGSSGEVAGAASGLAGPIGTSSPAAALQGNASRGRNNGTGVRVQGFKGSAGSVRGRFLGTGVVMTAFVMFVLELL